MNQTYSGGARIALYRPLSGVDDEDYDSIDSQKKFLGQFNR